MDCEVWGGSNLLRSLPHDLEPGFGTLKTKERWPRLASCLERKPHHDLETGGDAAQSRWLLSHPRVRGDRAPLIYFPAQHLAQLGAQ